MMTAINQRAVRAAVLAVLLLLSGCGDAAAPNGVGQAPASSKNRPVEYAFQHPAAVKVHNIFLGLKVYKEADYWQLPRRDRYVWDVDWFEDEVMNGGIDQFLYNSSGDHAAETLEALDAIGAKKSAKFLRDALALFPNQRANMDTIARRKQLVKIRQGRNLDDLIKSEIELDLYQLLLDYWKKADPRASVSPTISWSNSLASAARARSLAALAAARINITIARPKTSGT